MDRGLAIDQALSSLGDIPVISRRRTRHLYQKEGYHETTG